MKFEIRLGYHRAKHRKIAQMIQNKVRLCLAISDFESHIILTITVNVQLLCDHESAL